MSYQVIRDIVTLFWENKLSIDVEVRILPFTYLDVLSMTNRTIIASSYSRIGKLGQWCTIEKPSLTDGPYRPSDQFLRLYFRRCLAVNACRGDVMEDYKEDIENITEELGVYDG